MVTLDLHMNLTNRYFSFKGLLACLKEGLRQLSDDFSTYSELKNFMMLSIFPEYMIKEIRLISFTVELQIGSQKISNLFLTDF